MKIKNHRDTPLKEIRHYNTTKLLSKRKCCARNHQMMAKLVTWQGTNPKYIPVPLLYIVINTIELTD